MAARNLGRGIVLQSLFEWDFYGKKAKLLDIVKRNIEEFAPGFSERDFALKLAEDVEKNMEKLDEVIAASAPEWPVDKLPIVDRNVLRIGLNELLHADREEVPPRVAINEAIEIAKTYGGLNSGRFINGVMGTVYREIGEPDKKDDKPKKAKAAKDGSPASTSPSRKGEAEVDESEAGPDASTKSSKIIARSDDVGYREEALREKEDTKKKDE